MVKHLSIIIPLFFLHCIVSTGVYCQNTVNSILSFSIEKCNDSLYNNEVVTYKLSSERDTVERVRALLFDEMRAQNPNKQVITGFQSYLNNFKSDSIEHTLLSNEENLILYIYLREWDSVLYVISKLDYPYKVNLLSLEGKEVYVSENGQSFVPIKKYKFVNHEIFTSIIKSSLCDEEKEFLKLFIHSYFGYKIMENNIKLKVAYRKFRKKYPQSRYLRYILTDNKVYYSPNWHNKDK